MDDTMQDIRRRVASLSATKRGLVNTVKYTAVHNERTLFWCRYPRDDRVAFYSPFPSRPDVMGL